MPGLETEGLGEQGPVRKKDHEGPVDHRSERRMDVKRERLTGLNAQQREEVWDKNPELP